MLLLLRGSNPNCSLTNRTWSSKPVFLLRSSDILTHGWPSADRILMTIFIGFDLSTARFLRKSSIRESRGIFRLGRRERYLWRRSLLRNSIRCRVCQPTFWVPNSGQHWDCRWRRRFCLWGRRRVLCSVVRFEGQRLSGRRNLVLHQNILSRDLYRSLSETSLLKRYRSMQFLRVSSRSFVEGQPSKLEYVSRQSLRAWEFAWK